VVTGPYTWRQLCEARHDAVSEPFRRLSDRHQRLYWLFFAAALRHQVVLAYAELYLDHEARAVDAMGGLFTKTPGQAYVARSPIRSSIRSSTADDPGAVLELLGQADANQLVFRCTVQHALDLSAPCWRLRAVRAQLDFTPSSAAPMQRVGQWETSYPESDVELSMVDRAATITCPACFGDGAEVGFAIPKADAESGLTGYARFSCNMINASHACTVCGGSGSLFEDWYVREQPEISRAAKPFKRGSGQIDCERMAPIQTLSPDASGDTTPR
jgi:hypothetical protein